MDWTLSAQVIWIEIKLARNPSYFGSNRMLDQMLSEILQWKLWADAFAEKAASERLKTIFLQISRLSKFELE